MLPDMKASRKPQKPREWKRIRMADDIRNGSTYAEMERWAKN